MALLSDLFFLGLQEPITYRDNVSAENYAWMCNWVALDFVTREEMQKILVEIMLAFQTKQVASPSSPPLPTLLSPVYSGPVATIPIEGAAAIAVKSKPLNLTNLNASSKSFARIAAELAKGAL